MKHDDPRKTKKIKSSLSQEMRDGLVECLQSHRDVFAWSHKNIPGIDPGIACYKLAIKKWARPVKQKRRCLLQPGKVRSHKRRSGKTIASRTN